MGNPRTDPKGSPRTQSVVGVRGPRPGVSVIRVAHGGGRSPE